MATWDLWFPDVVIHAMAAPDPLVRQALCRASREFFRKSRAWAEWLEANQTMAGTSVEYDFELPSQSELLTIERATLDGNPLGVDSFRQRASDWTQEVPGDKALVSRDLVSFYLAGEYAAGSTVQAFVTLIPTLTATGIPDHLANRHMEAIAEGAKAILLMTPDTAFYKPDLAGVARSMFESAIATAGVHAYMGNTKQVPRARPKFC